MSEQGFSRNVEQGNQANMSAPAWNKVTSFVDEVANGTPRTLRVGQQQKIPGPEGRLVSLVKAEEDIETGDFLSMTGVNIDSSENENYFKYHGVPTVEKMTDGTKPICVAMQPIASGKYGRACITGVCIAKVSNPDGSSYGFYDISSTTAGIADLTTDDTGLRVIWEDGTTGTSLALVSVNLSGGGGGISSAFFESGASGIPAASSSTSPASATLTKLKFDSGTGNLVAYTPAVTDTVYNHTESAVAANKIIQAKTINGEWFIDVEPC